MYLLIRAQADSSKTGFQVNALALVRIDGSSFTLTEMKYMASLILRSIPSSQKRGASVTRRTEVFNRYEECSWIVLLRLPEVEVPVCVCVLRGHAMCETVKREGENPFFEPLMAPHATFTQWLLTSLLALAGMRGPATRGLSPARHHSMRRLRRRCKEPWWPRRQAPASLARPRVRCGSGRRRLKLKPSRDGGSPPC